MKRFSVVLSTAAALAVALSGCGGSDSGVADADTADKTTQTTCTEFKTLDDETKKSVVEAILAENPDSQFAGNQAAALGTAELVCLAEANTDKTVAEAARLLTPAPK